MDDLTNGQDKSAKSNGRPGGRHGLQQKREDRGGDRGRGGGGDRGGVGDRDAGAAWLVGVGAVELVEPVDPACLSISSYKTLKYSPSLVNADMPLFFRRRQSSESSLDQKSLTSWGSENSLRHL